MRNTDVPGFGNHGREDGVEHGTPLVPWLVDDCIWQHLVQEDLPRDSAGPGICFVSPVGFKPRGDIELTGMLAWGGWRSPLMDPVRQRQLASVVSIPTNVNCLL